LASVRSLAFLLRAVRACDGFLLGASAHAKGGGGNGGSCGGSGAAASGSGGAELRRLWPLQAGTTRRFAVEA
jgi:hypothetical protein